MFDTQFMVGYEGDWKSYGDLLCLWRGVSVVSRQC